MQVLVSFSTALRFVFWITVVAALAGGLLVAHFDEGPGGREAEVEVRAETADR
jgi:hypothetical protein